MQLQVKELCRLSKLNNCKLVAGENGLSKDVRWFFVCFFDDVDQWIHEKEIVFLTGVGINMNDFNLSILMEKFYRKNVSAIYILIGYQFNSIPDILVKLADKYNIPLFEMPNVIPLVEITKELSEMLLLSQNKALRAENIFKDILFGHETDIQWHAHNLELLGYKIPASNYIVKIQTPDFTFQEENKHNYIDTAINMCFNNSFIYFHYKHNFIIGIAMMNCTDALPYMRIKCRQLIDMISDSYKIPAIGISESFSSLYDAKKCLQHASQAINCIYAQGMDDIILFYEEIHSILKIILELDNYDILETCCKRILAPLIDYDQIHNTEYIKTLSIYMQEYNNNQKVSHILNIHRNTLSYRLDRIKKILNCDITNPDIIFELKTELFIYNYVSNRLTASTDTGK